MDKGTQEKVVEQKKDYRFDYDWAVICRGCKHLHHFNMALVYPNRLAFPNGDFSVISVYFDIEDEFFDYQNEEVMRPTKEQPDTVKKAFHLVAHQLDLTNKRVAELEKFVGMAKTEAEQKSLQERLADTEKITGRIAEMLLGKKETPTLVKGPPKGQHV